MKDLTVEGAQDTLSTVPNTTHITPAAGKTHDAVDAAWSLFPNFARRLIDGCVVLVLDLNPAIWRGSSHFTRFLEQQQPVPLVVREQICKVDGRQQGEQLKEVSRVGMGEESVEAYLAPVGTFVRYLEFLTGATEQP